jgi:hypothetical protein
MSTPDGTGSLNITDLWGIHNIVQNTQVFSPKEIIIGLLRDFFSEDTYYHYVADQWGFPKTPDHTNLSLGSGFEDDVTTRIFIGEKFRYDKQFKPALLVSSGGMRSTPISFNRELETIKYDVIKVIDGYGNQELFTTPSAFVKAGAWEGSVNIEVVTGNSVRSRDDLVELVSLFGQEIYFEELRMAGVFVKGATIASPSEGDYANEKMMRQIITLEIRTEWRREIPVNNLVDAINFCVEFGRLEPPPSTIAPNLQISTYIELADQIENI